jgi:hypothetical protein
MGMVTLTTTIVANRSTFIQQHPRALPKFITRKQDYSSKKALFIK